MKIASDYLVSISVQTLYNFGVNKGGGYGPIDWNNPIEIKVNTQINDSFMKIEYTLNSIKFDYSINLITTECNYGGVRYWIQCPRCDRRVGKVFLLGTYFLCRHCNNLTYESRLLSGKWKMAGKIISKLELRKSLLKVKRIRYNGKFTKKYMNFLAKEEKFSSIYKKNIQVLMSTLS